MDDLLNELNEEVVKAKPKNRLQDTSVELGKHLEKKLNQLQRDACISKKPKLTAKTVNGEYVYSGSGFQSKSSQQRAKVSSSRIEVTEESNTAAGYQYSIYIAT